MRQKILLFLLLAWVMSSTEAYAQTVGTNFKVGDIGYTITKKDLNNPQNNEVAVYYIGGSGAVTVPPTVQNDQDKETYKVTSSTEWTDCSKDIESLTFSEGYTTMGSGCYRSAANLKKVTLPASFTTMSPSCFENCPKFTEYEVAGSSSTFKNNDKGWLLSKDGTTLVSCPSGTQGDIVIPEGITTLAKTAFKVCRGIGKISIPKSLVNIDQSLDASFYAVGSYFDVADDNPAFKDVEGVLLTKDGKTLVTFPPLYDKTKLENSSKYTLPESVETVASEAFCQTESGLKTVDLKNAETLKQEAFIWPAGLQTVNIGKDVSLIEDGAFINCPKLTAFTVDGNNAKYMGKDDMIYSKDEKDLILCPTAKTGEYSIPEGTTGIAVKAFYGSAIMGIKFPSTLKAVGGQAFRFCRGLRTLDFGSDSHLETIYGTAFSSTGLAGTINIPASVKQIDARTFYNTKITSIHIADGSQLTEIKDQAFDELSDLESFVFDGTSKITSISGNAFANDVKLKHFVIPATVTTIGNGAFLNTPALETVEFKEPAAITTIGSGAFGNSGIKSINLPESVTTIDKQAFDNCKNLQTISIPKNVTNINTGAFNFCESLTDINVDKDNAKYSSLDGMLCTKDKKTLVAFPAGKADIKYTLIPYFTTVGQYAFYASDKVTNIIFPKSVTTIENRALALCKNLKSLSFMGTDNVPALTADIVFESSKPKDITIYVRKAWYENKTANEATVNTYNSTFKEVHPSFVSTADYDRGTEFFPTSTDNVGVISFYTPRTSVIIDKTAKETAYTDVYGNAWPEKTYTVSSVLDFAYQNEATVKDIVFLSDIGSVGLDAFKAGSQLKGLYFVGNTPGTLSSVGYEMDSDYPFNAGQTIYVKQSKIQAYQDTWTQGHTLNVTYKIPQQTNKNGGSVCFPFDVKYPEGQGNNDIKPYVPMDYSHAYDTTNPFVRAYSIDNYYVPAFVGALIRSKNTLSVNSYCQMDEDQAHDESALTAVGYSKTADNRMVGAVEDVTVANESGYQYYAFSKSQGKFVVLKKGATFPYFKAYFRMKDNAASPAKGFSIMFSDGNTVTGINSVTEAGKADNDAPYYSLNGMRVSKPTSGIYVHNGKKVIIK